jgi:hypothetical protein
MRTGVFLIDQRYGKLRAQQAENMLTRLETNHRAAYDKIGCIAKQEKT